MTAKTTASARTTRTLRPGQVVRYTGSVRRERGLLFRVNARHDCDGWCGGVDCGGCGRVSYDLSEWFAGVAFDDSHTVVLSSVRPGSVEAVRADVAAKARYETCGVCGKLYAVLPGGEASCPVPDGWQHTRPNVKLAEAVKSLGARDA